MKLTIETSSYNERRYGKPWIAKVDFNDKKGNFHFGDWIGQDGTSGLLEIDVIPGEIVARGQKDHRKPSNSAPEFYVVTDALELDRVSKAEAYKHWEANNKPLTNRDELLARKAELEAELAKINELLNIG